MLALRLTLVTVWVSCFTLSRSQDQNPGVGYPHDYPGKPSGDFNPSWQSYFEVTEPLPNVTWPIPRNWAGNIPVDRPGHPNDTLFFWAWEKEQGSLTAEEFERSDEPWGIWLNGGPGSSSMLGLLFENGPIHVASNYSLYSNPYGWNLQADYIWIDQPVGVGFSTADNTGFVADEDQMGEDFFRFLSNLVKVFPSLKHRPLYLTGESYAGTYIPYITKTYFGLEDPPVRLVKIAIGDGTIGGFWLYEEVPVVTVIETYPQVIGYDPDVFKYFQEQSHLCGFDFNLTYPQRGGYFPTLNPQFPLFDESTSKRASKKLLLKAALEAGTQMKQSDVEARSMRPVSERERRKNQWKRDLTGRANGTIDPWYGCDIYDEMLEYAFNFSLPWNGRSPDNTDENGFDIYDIPDALWPEAPMDGTVFLNNNVTRTAIHAPTSKDWVDTITYPFGNNVNNLDPSVEPMAFLTDLATNATRENIAIVIFSGNDDSLVTHRGSEVVIQNTTFGGIQGFSVEPSTPWYDDEGLYAGIVHQERNWTYVLIKGAGHLVPMQQPARASVLLREFILGHNETGLVDSSDGHTSVVGGADPNFTGVLTGQLGIYYGSGYDAGHVHVSEPYDRGVADLHQRRHADAGSSY
ncbi:hypothetical protein NM688_g3802 [Phlebia brevispora]|uniref:Uncharacterized protein n=1 Tax=Phlebia brevispora TaxID=194682 RepID=A0ACC1T4U9_9APHY|nr:hypothetical protein NM688_g3802 [Phlebia brevispora]